MSRMKIILAICVGCTFAYLLILAMTPSADDGETFDTRSFLQYQIPKEYDVEVPDHASMKKACHIPDVDPWHESVKPFVVRPQPFECPPPPPMSYLSACPTPWNDGNASSAEALDRVSPTPKDPDGPCQRPADWPPSLQPPPLLTLNLSHVDWSEDLECCAAELTRGEPTSKSDLNADFRFSVGECKPFYEATPLVSEFTVINCTRGGKQVYADIHGHAIPSKATLEKVTRASMGNATPTSILLVGIDSSSRLNFFRAMPKTRAVLERAGAVGMNAYNKVGDNTFPNLLAILAGTSEDDAMGKSKQSTKPKGYRCWPSSRSVVDGCPYLFKSFSQSGYVTLFTEDQPDLGTFTYGKKGFRNQPTDHFLRPYYLFAQSRLNVTQLNLDWCYSNKETHLRTMDYIRSFIGTYHSKVPFFGLVYFTSMSHNSPPDIELADDDMAEFMRDLIEAADSGMERNGEGLFLAMLSDHGARFGKLRESPLGWLEERLPFLYIRPPIRFNKTRGPATNYPLLVKSQYPVLVLNRNRLTSPFDLHFTLSSYLPGSDAPPSSSCSKCFDLLRQEVPLDRTCSEAAVPNKWCACAEGSKVPVDDPGVTDASVAAVDYINKKLVNNPECANLTIETIVAARHLSIRTQVNNREGVLKLLEVTFITKPGEAIFEANALKNKDDLDCASSPSSRTDTFEWKLAAIEEYYKTSSWGEQKNMLNFFLMKTRGINSLEFLLLRLGSPTTRDVIYALSSAEDSDLIDEQPPERFKNECNLEDYDGLEEEKLIEIIASLVARSSENMAICFYQSAVSLIHQRRQDEQKAISESKYKEVQDIEITTLLAELNKEDEINDKVVVADPCAQEEKPTKSKKGSKQRKGDKKSGKNSKFKEKKKDKKDKSEKKGKKDEKYEKDKKEKKGQKEKKDIKEKKDQTESGKKKGKGSKKSRDKGGMNDEMILRKKYKVPNAPEETVDWMMTLPLWANGIVMSEAITAKKDADNLGKVNEYWKYLVTCAESEKEARKTINKAISNLQDSWVPLLVAIKILSVLWLFIKCYIFTKPKDFPPGPIRWPIKGNLFQMKTDGYIHRTMSKWHKKYGEVVGFYAGNAPVVLISGFSAIQEGLMREDLSGRLGNRVLKIMNDGQRMGIVNTDGDVWKEQRSFTYHHLRQRNIGKCSQERIIYDEVKEVLNDIERMSGGSIKGYSDPVYFHDIFGDTMINILWNVLSGERYDHKDPELKHLSTSVNRFFQANEGTHSETEIREMCEPLFSLVEAMINRHKKRQETTDEYSNLRDFTDIYIKEIENQRSRRTSFNDQQMREVCAEVLIGGADTTFATLTYAMLFMVLFPEVQKKVQEELDLNVGKKRLPSLEDKVRLPYTEATVQEILRLSSIAALCVPHAPLTTARAVNFRGYVIPKGTRVHFNFYDLHHDPSFWDEPNELKPERHIDENGRLFQHESLFPFSGGIRTCPGQELARNSVFLILASILQRYTIKVPDGNPKPSMDPKPSVVLCPQRFEVKVQSRF